MFPMFDAMSLRQWAAAEGISHSTAARRFHAGRLTDRHGRPVHAVQQTENGVIRVYPNGPPDPLANVDLDDLVDRLERRGYVLLRPEDAVRLGLRSPSLEVAG